MFVTNDILEKYKACESGKRLFNKIYPNGVDISTLLDNKHIPFEVLHWGEEYLPVSKEELKKYYERVNVINSTYCKKSNDVINSRYIFKSYNIKESEVINLSSNIKNSRVITNCQYVDDSLSINTSNYIRNCTLVADSKNVNNSNNIAKSSEINFCDNLFNCVNLKNCNTVYNSSFCTLSCFSSFLTECTRVLFCTSIEHKNDMLFNKSIPSEVFYNVYKEFKKRIKEEKIELIILLQPLFSFYSNCEVQSNFQKMFQYLSNDFKEWIKTLPNYNNFIMYEITFNPEWLN